jgi:hypothetical protein
MILAVVIDCTLPRALDLTCTAWDLEPLAPDCGWSGPPFRWDEERRFQLRCELDAAFFHLYLAADVQGDWKRARQSDVCPHDETDEQLAELKGHFPHVPRRRSLHPRHLPHRPPQRRSRAGTYRPRDTILALYDQFTEASASGTDFTSPLNPPAGDPRACHPKRKIAILAFGSLRGDPGKIGDHIAFRIKTYEP